MSYQEIHTTVIETFGLQDYPPELQEAFLEQFGDILFQALLLKGAESVPAEHIGAFDALIQTDPEPGEVFEFFEQHIPRFESMVSDVVTELRKRSDEIVHEFSEEINDEV